MERIWALDHKGNRIYDKHGRPAYVWSYHTPNQRSYFHRIMHWVSQGLNVFLGGHQDLTFSQRVGGWRRFGHPLGKPLSKFINFIFFDSQHCQNAWIEKV
jgi:hypothetical protein